MISELFFNNNYQSKTNWRSRVEGSQVTRQRVVRPFLMGLIAEIMPITSFKKNNLLSRLRAENELENAWILYIDRISYLRKDRGVKAKFFGRTALFG